MTPTTSLEKEIMLKLFKEFTVDYNSSNISKGIGKTRVGAYKALKMLEKKGLVKGKRFGKATFYKVNLGDEYVKKAIDLLLLEEARQKKRWLEEFKEIYGFASLVILFGSIVKNENKAGDIDLLIVLKQKDSDALTRVIDEKNKMLIQKIHTIKQTKEDLEENINKSDKVILSAIKNGIVLHGSDFLVEMIRNVRNG